MLTIPPSTRIFVLAPGADMRRSFDGLTALARDVIGENPTSGHLFCFSNRRRTRLKVLFFDGSGMWVMCKRLERGTFAWPHAEEGSSRVVLQHAQLAALTDGLDISKAKLRSWYRRDPHAAEKKSKEGLRRPMS